jgi:hypothetical protein
MKHLGKLCVLLFAACSGCADGGPVGTGIGASLVTGNVTEVQVNGSASVAVPPVRVSIDEAPGIEDTTDAHGNFALEGDFSGLITLRFRAENVEASERIEVPAGSEVTLEDVQIRPGAVQTSNIELGRFFGRVELVDCFADASGADILVKDQRRVSANQFLVRVTSETVIVRGDGLSLACAQIDDNVSIAVAGRIRRVDGTIEAITIVIGPPPPGNPQPVEQRRFRGTVTPVINCQTRMILIFDDMIGETRLTLLPNTAIVDANQQSLRCSDISVGNRVDGVGVINVRRPGAVEVLRMTVRPPVSS